MIRIVRGAALGAVLALDDDDWLFPTYRDSVAIVTRSVDPVEVLSLLRGEWHCGYDPHRHRVAPQCTPLATNTLHAVGLAQESRLLALQGEQGRLLLVEGREAHGRRAGARGRGARRELEAERGETEVLVLRGGGRQRAEALFGLVAGDVEPIEHDQPPIGALAPSHS